MTTRNSATSTMKCARLLRRRRLPQQVHRFRSGRPCVVGQRRHQPVALWAVLVLFFVCSLSSRSDSILPNTFLVVAEEEFVVAAEQSTEARRAQEEDVLHCPGPDEAFVTTCSGGSGGENNRSNNDEHDNNNDAPDDDERTSSPSSPDDASTIVSNDDDDFDLVNEVLSDGIINNTDEGASKQKDQQQNQHDYIDSGSGSTNNGRQHEQQQSWSDGAYSEQQQQQTTCTNNAFDEDTEYSAYHQLKKTTTTFVRRYYSPLDKRGKCAIGSACGFLASRLSLGVANRIFRVAGATWVFSEAVHASGLCDEKSCAVIPEEARPWIVILRRSIGKKVESIRDLARRIWNKDRIREIAQQDEALACGLAAGAFVGFIV